MNELSQIIVGFAQPRVALCLASVVSARLRSDYAHCFSFHILLLLILWPKSLLFIIFLSCESFFYDYLTSSASVFVFVCGCEVICPLHRASAVCRLRDKWWTMSDFASFAERISCNNRSHAALLMMWESWRLLQTNSPLSWFFNFYRIYKRLLNFPTPLVIGKYDHFDNASNETR